MCYQIGNFFLRFVEAVLKAVLEKNEESRVASGALIAAMLSRGLLSEVRNLLVVVKLLLTANILQGQFLTALVTMLTLAENLLVDIPKFWDFLAQVSCTSS